MANTTAVYARIDSDLKKGAEDILSKLGISPSSAIQMLYSQIILTNSFPINLQLHTKKPICVEELTEEELNNELLKGIESAKNEKHYTISEVDDYFKSKYDI